MAEEDADVGAVDDGGPSKSFAEVAAGLTGMDFGEGVPKPEAIERDAPPVAEPELSRQEPQDVAPRIKTAEPRPKPEPTPDPQAEQTVSLRGKTYKVSELQQEIQKDPSLAVSLATTYNQFGDLQNRYQQERDRRLQDFEARERERNQPPPAPVDPLARKRAVAAEYGPRVLAGIQAGTFNGDFAQDYPDLAPELLYHSDLQYAMAGALIAIQQRLDGMSSGTSQKEYREQHERALDKLAERDEFFGALKDADHREQFKQFLGKKNPDDSVGTDPDQLEDYYLMFSKKPVLEAVRAGSHKEREDATRGAVTARGPARTTRAGGRPGTAPPKTADEANFAGLYDLATGRGR